MGSFANAVGNFVSNAAKNAITGPAKFIANMFAAGQGVSDHAVSAQQSFNAQQAQDQRNWEEYMSNTAVQRQVADIKAAGLNPWLALNGGSVSGASTPAGASASSNSAFAEVYGMSSMMKFTSSMMNSAVNAMSAFAKAAASIASHI